MRILAVDVGRRRVGLAISDPSGMLARPLSTLTVTPSTMLEVVAAEIERLSRQDDGLGRVVVGLPRHLDGTDSAETRSVEQFVSSLRTRVTIPIATEDERLSSHEAQSRLALRDRDWRTRKARLDAAAAAVILQDHLERTPRNR